MAATIVTAAGAAGAMHPCLPAGFAVDRYRLGAVLGQGSFGITYLAHDPDLDRTVAIKEYFPTAAVTRDHAGTVRPLAGGEAATAFGQGLARFRREGRMLAKAGGHPGIVPVYALVEQNETVYLVMEQVVGAPLSVLLDQHRLAPAAIVALAAALLEALAFLHRNNLVHGDVKPENIMVRTDGQPVLIDFGSSRLLRPCQIGAAPTLGLTVTLEFAAPELLTADPKVTPAADLFAWGATVYRAVNGGLPPDAGTRMLALQNHGRDPLVPLASLEPAAYPAPFLALVDRVLALPRDQRPETRNALGLLQPLIRSDPAPRAGERAHRPWLTAGAVVGIGAIPGLDAAIAALGVTAAVPGLGLGGLGLMAHAGRLSTADTLLALAAAPALILLDLFLHPDLSGSATLLTGPWTRGWSLLALKEAAVSFGLLLLVRWGWWAAARGRRWGVVARSLAVLLMILPGLVLVLDIAADGLPPGILLPGIIPPPVPGSALWLAQAILIALGLVGFGARSPSRSSSR